MSLLACVCACFVLRCDGCGVALADEGSELHFTDADPAGASLVEVAESFGWTTDGGRWHCGDCPRLDEAVCEPCQAGQHVLCEDPACACALEAPLPGQGTFPFGEAPHG
jgi:hypothetical protein